MVSLNLKPEKIRNRNVNITLDQLHTMKCEKFMKDQYLLDNNKKKAEQYKQQLEVLECKDPKDLTDEDIILKSKYKTILGNLSEKIECVESCDEQINYYSEISDILIDYYNNHTNNDGYDNKPVTSNSYQETINDMSDNIDSHKYEHNTDKLKTICDAHRKKQKAYKETRHRKPVPINKNNILSYYNIKNDSDSESDSDDDNGNSNSKCGTDSIDAKSTSPSSIIDSKNQGPSLGLGLGQSQEKKKQATQDNKINLGYINDENLIIKKITKKKNTDLFNDYRYIIDPNYIIEKNKVNKNFNKYYEKCIKCSVDKKINVSEGVLFCSGCGDVQKLFIEPEKMNSKDKVSDKVSYPYKKINHFNEWLNQIQAKQTTDIPNEVLNGIKGELKKNRIYDYSTITPTMICKILKKIKHSKYKEHHIYITYLLNGIAPPTLSRSQEDELRNMFILIQEPYMKHKPKGRINFSSYSFIIYKLCERCGFTHMLKSLNLLKSPDKLRDLENTWKKVCFDLGW